MTLKIIGMSALKKHSDSDHGIQSKSIPESNSTCTEVYNSFINAKWIHKYFEMHYGNVHSISDQIPAVNFLLEFVFG